MAKLTIDIHCHPALKSYLFENSVFDVKLQVEHKSVMEVNYFRLQTDIPNMKKGNVQAAISSHYIPEKGLLHESSLLKGGSELLNVFWKRLYEKIEKEEQTLAVFEQTIESIDIFERKVKEAEAENADVVIAHSFHDFKKSLSEGGIVFLHSVEGAHSLGRNLLSLTKPARHSEDYIRNLDIFFDKGVCMLTLGHFYDNDIVSPTEGIPPSQRKLFNRHLEKDLKKGLSAIGEDVVRRMIEKGIIIDLSHSTPLARRRIFEINNEYKQNKRPLIFSHSGVSELFSNDKYPDDKWYSPDTGEILKIKECNGVIGLVFMNYWLSGKEDRFLSFEPGMEYLFKTIQMIRSVTNSYDNISIGSDFDAMNNPSDDMFNHSLIPGLWEYLAGKGISEADLEKIMSGNAIRVLGDGWGR